MDTTEPVLDGNVLAGALGALFQHDVTMATVRCGECGRCGPLAETRVYADAPGAVVRCAGCEAVLLTIVSDGGRSWLGFGRLRCLELRQ
jgi:ribosomal protein S27E